MDPLGETRPNKVAIRRDDWDRMVEDVEKRRPEEACGLVAGTVTSLGFGRTEAVIPVTNALHSPVRFRMAPEEQLRAFQQLEARGLDLLAIYHSHPQGPDRPSETDIAEAYYPEAVYLIWFRRDGAWRCRGYRIEEGSVREVPIVLIDSE